MVGEGDRGGDLSGRGATPVLAGALGLGTGLANGMGLPVGDEDLDEDGVVVLEEVGGEDVASLSSPSDLEEGPNLGRLSWSSDEPRSDSDLAFFLGRGGPGQSVDRGTKPSPGPIPGDTRAETGGLAELSLPGSIGTGRVCGMGRRANNSSIARRPCRDGPGVLMMGGEAPPDMIWLS